MTVLATAVGCGMALGAALLPLRDAAAGAAVVLGCLIWFGAAVTGGPGSAHPLAAACVFLLVLLVRRLARDRRRAGALLKAERAAQDARLEARAMAERERIARDLHDGLTHLLTSELLVLQAAQADLADGHAAAVRGRLDVGVSVARRALAEARTVIDILGGQSPHLGTLQETITEWTAATGHDVDVRFPRELRLADGTGWSILLATLREALTNIARHSPGSYVVVGLAYDNGYVHLSISNREAREAGAAKVGKVPPGDQSINPPDRRGGTPGAGSGSRLLPAGGGTGLQGLRERAALAGGRLSAGADAGTWQVRLRLPAEAETRPQSASHQDGHNATVSGSQP